MLYFESENELKFYKLGAFWQAFRYSVSVSVFIQHRAHVTALNALESEVL